MYMPPLVSSTSLLESQRNDANAMAERVQYCRWNRSALRGAVTVGGTDQHLAQWNERVYRGGANCSATNVKIDEFHARMLFLMLLEHKTGLRYAHIHTQTIMDHLHAAP